MNPAQTCPTCAAPLPDGAPAGVPCPACAAALTVIDGGRAGSTIAAPLRETIGDFEITEKLGAGGMGAVYRARQISLDRLVALKVLPSQFADDADYITRFQREAKIAAGFHHPNLVSVLSYGTADGVHYIAMELVEGENLHQLMRTRRIDMAEALGITAYVAQGLKCGWETAQLVHRDIKPSNIYVSFGGAVKVGDLGLAKSLTSNTTGITQTGAMMGTPHYMSPEQCRGDKTIDFRADIYSLGCMLFEMLTQHPPYPGSDPVAIVHKHLNAPPPGLLKALPGCPLPLALLVGKMLKKNARDRHASYDELIAEIEALYEHIERGEALDPTQFRRPVQRATPVETVSDGMPEWVWWSGAALIAVALAIVFWPKSESKPPVAAVTPAAATATPGGAKSSPVGQALRLPASPAPKLPPANGALALQPPSTAPGSGSWQQLFARDKWKAPMHLTGNSLFRTELVADRAIRARVRWQDGSAGVGLLARATRNAGDYHLEMLTRDTVRLAYFPAGRRGENITVLGSHSLPKPLQPGDTALLELHVQGDRMTALVDGAVVIEARDSRLPGPGVWGIVAGDGWYETVEVQTPPPAAAASERWQDLLAPLTPERLAQTGDGWRLEGGALRSPDKENAVLPLPGSLAGTSFQVRVKIRQRARKNAFAIILPVADRQTYFVLDTNTDPLWSGLGNVDGKWVSVVAGAVQGRQVNDAEWHALDVTVRLDGPTAKITAALDAHAFYEWTGPVASLSLPESWAKTPPSTLALGTLRNDWEVSEVKAKRLEGVQ